jgi:hypothetical protein
MGLERMRMISGFDSVCVKYRGSVQYTKKLRILAGAKKVAYLHLHLQDTVEKLLLHHQRPFV